MRWRRWRRAVAPSYVGRRDGGQHRPLETRRPRRRRRSSSCLTAPTRRAARCRRCRAARPSARSRSVPARARTGPIPLSAVAALGGPGSSCTQVTDLSVLDDVIGQQVGSTLSALAVSVDGGPAVPVPAGQHRADPSAGRSGVRHLVDERHARRAATHNICVTAHRQRRRWHRHRATTASRCRSRPRRSICAGQTCSVTDDTTGRERRDRDPHDAGRHRDGRAPASGDRRPAGAAAPTA